MPPLIGLFSLLALVDVGGVAGNWPVLEWIAKPLLAPVLAVHLWRRTGARHRPVPGPAVAFRSATRRLALAGLAFATAGDVALLLPGTAAFGVGLVCFLGAQLCWTAAFLRAGALSYLRPRRVLGAAYLGGWAVAVGALAPRLGPVLGAAVAVYAFALISMALTARVLGPRGACGGLVFVASDLFVGLGAAGIGFPGSSVLVMVTYTVALVLLVDGFARALEGGGCPAGQGATEERAGGDRVAPAAEAFGTG
ncbi:lysoplasmalogenase [Streptomyces mangrovisoli]|uniref:Lysoplasmalogenase n=1 Tax=Streptomyces mangrovisoli TaxID=1428628 RepID=A0A1J4P1G1_9ACTN|nr:lysoplasmalogenase [Streptomyces mangrovisoli]OIJ67317.1 hypothetical protein WN71_013700 [Streptomyces mangrovisoli]